MSAPVPKYAQAAAIVRAQIADGTLKPGSPAPSGEALARATGYSALTCRKALRSLIMDGTLRPGPSPNARPRVAGTDLAGTDLAARAAALSGALADRRRAAGCTQLDLAAITGYAVTTIGHAETGRLWQSRTFWETADKTLSAAGELLRLHDDYRAALTRDAVPAIACATIGTGKAPAGAPVPAPVSVTITWRDGTTTTTVRQPAPLKRQEAAMTPLTNLDDSTLISQRREIRTALEKLPPKSHAAQSLAKQHDALNDEFGRRVARSVDTLLADPETLGNDALETDLYLLREKLREQAR